MTGIISVGISIAVVIRIRSGETNSAVIVRFEPLELVLTMRERYDLASKLALMALVISARGSALAASGAVLVDDDELLLPVESELQPAPASKRPHNTGICHLL